MTIAVTSCLLYPLYDVDDVQLFHMEKLACILWFVHIIKQSMIDPVAVWRPPFRPYPLAETLDVAPLRRRFLQVDLDEKSTRQPATE